MGATARTHGAATARLPVTGQLLHPASAGRRPSRPRRGSPVHTWRRAVPVTRDSTHIALSLAFRHFLSRHADLGA